MNSDIRDRVCELVGDALDVAPEEIAASDDLGNVDGWDSLRQLNLMLALEETFDIVLEPDDMAELTSVSRIAGLVDSRLTR